MNVITLNTAEIPATKLEAVCKSIQKIMGGNVWFNYGTEHFIYGQS